MNKSLHVGKTCLLPNLCAAASSPARTAEMGNMPIPITSPYQLIQARHGWMLANPNDLYVGCSILEYGEYGEVVSQFLMLLLSLRPGKVVEVGANVGAHTIPLANALLRNQREMLVFESQRLIFQNLCANLALNGITSVTALPFACGANVEVVYYPLLDQHSQNNFGAVPMEFRPRPGTVNVPRVRLDDMVGLEQVSLMKIDAQGYELPALQGASNILKRSRPLLYVQNDRVDKSKELIEWLWSQNYQLFWHMPQLFNPDNYFRKAANMYGAVASFSMLCLPREFGIANNGAQEISNATFHPMAT